MDADGAVAEEERRALKKHKTQDGRLVDAKGYAAGAEGRAITRAWLPLLAARLATPHRTKKNLGEFYGLINQVDKSKLALCILSGALNSIGQQESYRDTARRIGGNIHAECWGAGLFQHYRKRRHPFDATETVDATEIAQQIEREAHGSLSKARAEAATYGGYKKRDWSPVHLLKAGNWGIEQLVAYLPGVFKTAKRPSANKDPKSKKRGPETILVLTEEAQQYAARNIAELIRKDPVWLPTSQPPLNWEGWNKGGTSDPRLAGTLCIVSKHNAATKSAVQTAIRDGEMKPTLDALNALQAVPWQINKRVLKVRKDCLEHNIPVDGLPHTPLPLPKRGEFLTKYEYARRKRALETRNHAAAGSQAGFAEDIAIAERLSEHERFWTPMYLDWRGRMYGVPHFNFQRDDRVRALFLFANGEPIGEEGLYWLKVHVANRGDFDKISKRPFHERAAWVDEHLNKISSAAAAPLDDLWWTEADNPFQFLAACFELTAALAGGPSFVSGLPISFDGSCSGLQHLSAMTRDEKTAKQVNLLPSKIPQDIYQTVADQVEECVERDLTNKSVSQLARLWADYGISRKLVKRNVMSSVYGSEVYGMQEQLREEVMLTITNKVQTGELARHTFGKDNGNAAVKYLAKVIYSAIKSVAKRPTEAMAFLQTLARAAAKENKYLKWSTPVGFPWANRYYEQDEAETINLFLQKVRIRINLVTKEKPTIDKRKAANGASPNFVHACDAAHLMLTVNAAVAEGISSIATVHDSFGCLASRAARFRQIIREEFVRMYEEHDVLQEILDQTREALNGEGAQQLPEKPPAHGSLDITQALEAEYAFA